MKPAGLLVRRASAVLALLALLLVVAHLVLTIVVEIDPRLGRPVAWAAAIALGLHLVGGLWSLPTRRDNAGRVPRLANWFYSLGRWSALPLAVFVVLHARAPHAPGLLEIPAPAVLAVGWLATLLYLGRNVYSALVDLGWIKPKTPEAEPEITPPLRLKIKRRPGGDAPPHWHEVEVPFDEKQSVLVSLRTVEGLEVATPCADQKCGQCAMLLNGEALLACRTKHGDLEDPIEVRVLPEVAGTKDLLIDAARIAQRRGELPSAGCIDCGLCLEVCPSYSAAGQFPGPAALFRAEAAKAPAPPNYWECDNVGNCTAVCPEKLPLLESIAALKRRAGSS